jgi:hypothetical protein
MTHRWLSKSELAAYFYESPKQIERYIAEGMPYMGTGKQRRFPMPECKQWRDQHIRRQSGQTAERHAADLLERLAAKMSGMGGFMGDARRATTVVEAAVFLERMGDELRNAVQATVDELHAESGE